MKHSPTPWTADQPAMGFSALRDARGRLVFALAAPSPTYGDPEMSDEEKEVNLAFILDAVNAEARK
jgi:hypothetical protein